MAVVGVSSGLLVGCDLGSGPPPIPSSLEAAAGLDQTATVVTPVPIPPAVRVLNKRGRPMRGREVVFFVASGGGQVSGNVSLTDQEGIARVGTWILGPTAGDQTLQAHVPELPPLTFTATGTAASPASIIGNGGGGQTGMVGSTLDLKPSVLVKDVYGNPVDGAAIGFEVTEGGGFLSQTMALTDASGIAESGSWTLGVTQGPNGVSALLEGFPPVLFAAEGVPDVPSRATVLLGDGQTATVGQALPLRPTLLVADRFGNLLEGVPVLFEAGEGSGAIADGQQTTGPSGVAVAGPWTLGTVAGPQALEISVPGVDPLTLIATAEAGSPASAVPHGGLSQTATVGTAVTHPPTVRIEDAFGNPVPGVPVAFYLTVAPDPESSPGSIDGSSATSDQAGLASVGSWFLGIVAGSYGVAAQIAGLADPIPLFATATPDTPASLEIHRGDDQTVLRGTTVPIPPSVEVVDQYDNGVPEVLVRFEILEGEGVLTGPEAFTDEEGVASLGGWTLGSVPGTNRLSAAVEGVDGVVFSATGLTAPPASITRVTGRWQTARVGTQVPTPPQVLVTDVEGNPVPSVPVHFVVTAGSGTLTGGEPTTDSDGMASVGNWTLGTTAGTNTLSVSAEGLPEVTFGAIGIPGPPVSMSEHGGQDQSALVSSGVPVPPAVVLEDSFGNGTPGVTVTFAVTAGGGVVTGTPTTTDPNGLAEVESWTLGSTPGVNQLTAAAPGVPGVVFSAFGVEGGSFDIDLQFMTATDPSVSAVFVDAVTRWQEIVVGDIPDYDGSLTAGGCQPVAVEGGIDDVRVYVTVQAIDGSGGVLGRAGPCYYRTGGTISPITGIMEFDEADVADLKAAGLLEDVIVNELGHVLGFGTLWNASSNDFLVGAGSADPYFNGPAAIAAFDAAGGAARTSPKVPVENTGGSGTRDGHWRETVHNSELMTGWIEGGGVLNPLSEITIASLADMGYIVDMSAADPYVLFNPMGAPTQYPSGNRVYIQELPPPTPIPAGSGGGGFR